METAAIASGELRELITASLAKVAVAEHALLSARNSLSSLSRLSEQPLANATADQLWMTSPTTQQKDLRKSASKLILENPDARQTVEIPRNPTIELEERKLLGAIAERSNMEADTVKRCYELFEQEDTDKSGTLTTSELRNLMEAFCACSISDEEFEQISEYMCKFDDNGDGVWNFDEVLNAFNNKALRDTLNLEKAIEDTAVEAKDQIKGERETAKDIVNTRGVDKAVVRRYLRKELREAASCWQLPPALALFLCFLGAVVGHRQTVLFHAIDRAIQMDIVENANFAFSGNVPFENGRMGHKNIDDVNSFADFWSWFNMGLVPLLFPEGWDKSEVRTNVVSRCGSTEDLLQAWGWSGKVEALNNTFRLCPESGSEMPENVRSFYGDVPAPTYLYHNSIVGGVRLLQERARTQQCTPNTRFSFHSSQCFSNNLYWLKPELHTGLLHNEDWVDTPGGETHYLLSGSKQSAIRQITRALEDQAWIGPGTAKVEILLPTYNPHIETLTATFITFFFNRAGHIHKLIEPITIPMEAYNSWSQYVFDLCWLFLVLKLCLGEIYEISMKCRTIGICNGIRHYCSLPNLVDWLSILYAGIIITLWIQFNSNLSKLKALLLSAEAAVPGSFSNSDDRINFYDTLHAITMQQNTLRSALAGYPFVIVSRLFKACSTQPRLALVTNTLASAAIDIIHFGFVFLIIFAVYTSSAYLLFGPELEEFAGIVRAWNSVMRLMIGDFDWVSMIEVGRPQCILWFWSFTWLVNLIMLNMLLAIIMDVYTEVRGKVGAGAETLWSQFFEIMIRMRAEWQGRKLPLHRILKALDPLCDVEGETDDIDAEGMLTIESLGEQVPGLSVDQAFEVLLEAEKFSEQEEHISQSITDAMAMIQTIDRRTTKTHSILEHMILMSQMETKLRQASQEAKVNGQRQKEKLLHSIRPGAQSTTTQARLEESVFHLEKLAVKSIAAMDRSAAVLSGMEACVAGLQQSSKENSALGAPPRLAEPAAQSSSGARQWAAPRQQERLSSWYCTPSLPADRLPKAPEQT